MEFNSIFSNETQLIDDDLFNSTSPTNSKTGGNLSRSSRLHVHVFFGKVAKVAYFFYKSYKCCEYKDNLKSKKIKD